MTITSDAAQIVTLAYPSLEAVCILAICLGIATIVMLLIVKMHKEEIEWKEEKKLKR